jgi:hypothetical protein
LANYQGAKHVPHLRRGLLFSTNTQCSCAARLALGLACIACCAYQSALQTGKALQAPDDQLELPLFFLEWVEFRVARYFPYRLSKAGTTVVETNSFGVLDVRA